MPSEDVPLNFIFLSDYSVLLFLKQGSIGETGPGFGFGNSRIANNEFISVRSINFRLMRLSRIFIACVLIVFWTLSTLAQAGRAVADSTMQSVYNEVKTPYKYGLVLVPESDSKKIDCPSFFHSCGCAGDFSVKAIPIDRSPAS